MYYEDELKILKVQLYEHFITGRTCKIMGNLTTPHFKNCGPIYLAAVPSLAGDFLNHGKSHETGFLKNLFEELLHAARGPLVMEVPALGGVGHVTGVQQQAQHFRLVQAIE
jgi:hypothetical protein